jgi:hypothetical protein
MGNDRGSLGWLLEIFVALALVGTFAVYSNPGKPRPPSGDPDEIAALVIKR